MVDTPIITMQKGKILGIMSAKGGVGKTTVTANLGVALTMYFNKNILAVDGNITTANLGFHLGLINPSLTLHDALDGHVAMTDVIYIHNSGLCIIPASLSIKKTNRIEYLKSKSRMKSKFGQFDIVLLDSAPGLSRESLVAMESSDKLLIVANPEFPCITVAMKQIELAKKIGKPVIGIILNRVKNDKNEFTREEVEESLELPVIAEIPEDKKVYAAIAKHMPVVQYAPNSKSSIAFKKLAAYLTGEKYEINFLERLKLFFDLNMKIEKKEFEEDELEKLMKAGKIKLSKEEIKEEVLNEVKRRLIKDQYET